MERLRQILHRIDGKGYKAYKDLEGVYRFPTFRLWIDYVQGDPFASPSRIRIELQKEQARVDPDWIRTPVRQIAFQDWVARKWGQQLDQFSFKAKGTGKSGLMTMDRPGQAILRRTAVIAERDRLEVRLHIGLPARGRTILGRQAEQMLLTYIPRLVREMSLTEEDRQQIRQSLELADNQQAIRQALREKGWIAFISDGAILPRESGISDRPLKKGQVIPFRSPESMRVEIPVPHGDPVTGMAIPEGITLIVGGGYHGKSTLLKAIERGVYNHIAGDGREYVITVEDAVKIRAEDGRRVEKVNISPFINRLPFGKETGQFSTDDASGSTSQAANIMESLEMGCSCLLIDEDTSATNFMIRDARMQALVVKDKEPITPFIDKIRQLYEEENVSTILVLGGSGDYFDVADHVIMMDHYVPHDVTFRAKETASRYQSKRKQEGGQGFGRICSRIPLPSSFSAQKGRKEKVDAKGLKTILLGTTTIDLSYLEQLVDSSQTRAIAQVLRLLGDRANGERDLSQLLHEIEAEIRQKGLDFLSPFHGHPGDLAMPRKYEIAAAINRMRTLKVKGENLR
ncbi:ABC-ATPase domain-containing protein [Thermoactinomyces mirandus]|uniref:ABC-ATPase domain-containing protein n=1 Tax=Thermoactinomyces mirandus TaxID=2756294 RepID=A0A7W2ARR8_9BACL|nr:ABC-ATPase domain-containing protein [Thermoactinomyces mirandus]MBA4601880.1 ABC-ATPase domain-containing protein [Thermoactinomyces mirandus]